VTFFKRLFSADYRAAVSAEAAGDLELAAERYALAGHHEAAVRMHLARAERASSRAEEIAALRDALHWCAEEDEQRAEVARALGLALYGRARAEGIATERDRDRVREAAELLEEGDEFLTAGQAWESVGDDPRAVHAYSRGGLVDRMEEVLARDEQRADRDRQLRQAFADYEMHLRSGARDMARDALQSCVELADNKGEYRRLLDKLDSALITGGRAVLRVRQGERVAVCSASSLLIGRDALCDLALRSGGISRRHAEILAADDGYRLRDAGSRNGTLIGGMPITRPVPLEGSGHFGLGDDVEIAYEVTGEPPLLSLHIESGLDRGSRLLAAPASAPIELATVGLPVQVVFRDGRPLLTPVRPEVRVLLRGEPVGGGLVQLLHGDQLSIDGAEVDVL
jgi:tetratricopeptide (TPR) repeat protein